MSSGITLVRVGAEEINDFVGFEEQLASYIKDSPNRVTRNEIYAIYPQTAQRNNNAVREEKKY